MTSKKIILLIDHFNWDFAKQDLVKILKQWLAIILDDRPLFYNLSLRSYGGWKSDGFTSKKRYDAFAYYQKSLPSIITMKNSYIRINFEFADYVYPSKLIQDHQIDNTLIFRKSKNYFTKNKENNNCEEKDCELKKITKWMKSKKACTAESCMKSFSDFFVRVEQKQVDTLIVSDLLMISMFHSDIKHVGLLSNDLDFAPAFISLIAHNRTNFSSIRVKNRKWYIDNILNEVGINIIEV